MGIRVLCLICAAVVLITAFFGIHGEAQGWRAAPPGRAHLSKASAVRSSTPLASAMLLVLGGLGISILFDKKNKK